jgi:2-oxoglutarate/2-oxoacid ferredoxin oxidoreductase subunit beta
MPGCHCHDTSETKFGDYFSENLYTWCTNCGNFGIHAAIKRALVAEQIQPCETLLCFDIGCHGNGSDKIGGYRFHGLHGRIISFACGAAVANRNIHVLAFGGDGGTLGEGINHLIAGVRGNYNVTFVLHNNLNYGLTQGQASPTTKPGVKMNSNPDGITADPLHPMRFMLSLHPTFVARTFSGDIKHMTSTFQAGLNHKGFSFIEVLQSCPTYNRMTPHEWYQQRVKDVSQIAGYNSQDYEAAAKIAEDLENNVAIGVLYQNPESVPFMERQANRIGKTTELVDEVQPFSTKKLFDVFR